MAYRSNILLVKAKFNKQDEFYTQLSDIEKELVHYESHFKDKVVYCNCDDKSTSNFVKYFSDNSEKLNLKKIMSSGIDDNSTSQNFKKGDFRSPESIALLKECDIVVTNPPFSLFREYVAQLIEYDKKFLIIGNINAITYKEIFKMIQDNKLWMGIHMGRGISGFIVPDHYELYGTEARIDANGDRIVSPNNCAWFTNLETFKRKEELILYKTYNESDYPKYDNCLAFEVSKVKDIPVDMEIEVILTEKEFNQLKLTSQDYEIIEIIEDGDKYKVKIKNPIYGVPITFLHKFNPDQFEIIRFRKGDDGKDLVINGKAPYFRILISKK